MVESDVFYGLEVECVTPISSLSFLAISYYRCLTSINGLHPFSPECTYFYLVVIFLIQLHNLSGGNRKCFLVTANGIGPFHP